MSEKTQEELSSDEFKVEKQFDAYKEDDGDFITINDCRITRTTINEESSHGQKIKHQFSLNADADVMALYIQGDEMKKANPSIRTARGRCIFFVYNESDHDPITMTSKLRIKKTANFYFKQDNAIQFTQSTFDHFVNVPSTTAKLVFSSSPRTGHASENIVLFP